LEVERLGELNTGEDSDVNVKDGSPAEQKSTSDSELKKHSGAIKGLWVMLRMLRL